MFNIFHTLPLYIRCEQAMQADAFSIHNVTCVKKAKHKVTKGPFPEEFLRKKDTCVYACRFPWDKYDTCNELLLSKNNYLEGLTSIL